MNLGDRQRATELLKESLLRFRELADKPGIATALIELGHIATDDGDYEQAQALYEESLALYREIGDVGGYIAQCLSSLGRVAMRQGDLLRAEKLLEESLMLEREVGLILDPAHLITLGLTVLSQGDSERATELIREGFRLACEQEDRLNITLGIEAIAMVAVTRGRAERMAVLWGTATTLREIAGNPLTPDVRLVYEPYLDAACALGEAAWETAVAEGQAMTLEEAVDYALSEEEAATLVSPTPKQLPPSAQAASLTRRQQEIAALVARGLTNRQIASELSISEHTVATHVAKILKKLELSSRAQLAAWITETSADQGSKSR
jgi:non-specific serine/threonine protein kinase